MTQVAIVGGSGYTGAELLRLLQQHPCFELTLVTSRQYAGQPVTSLFPNLRGLSQHCFVDASASEVAAAAELVFVAVPHGQAMDWVPPLLEAGLRVVDLSADYRLREATVYEAWYQSHNSAGLLEEVVYGLPEWYAEALPASRLVANPGCYPTGALLPLGPLVKEGGIKPDSLVVDSKSGISGAGRALKEASLFCEAEADVRAYGIGQHRHTPEIDEQLRLQAGQEVSVTFTPHLLPMVRGILTTVYGSLQPGWDEMQIAQLLARWYQDCSCVRLLPQGELPRVAAVAGSNFCDIGWLINEKQGRFVGVSAIDNLIKGAAGQALQNANLMCGLPAAAGLELCPLWP